MEKRQLAERKWHDQHFDRSRPLVISDAVRLRYSKRRRFPLFPREMLFKLAGDVRGKDLLAYGCGDDSMPHLFAMMGAQVTAFDLSTTAVYAQREMALANCTVLRLAQAAAEQLPFAAGSFDLIVGTAVLHHLPDALPLVPNELRRVLRADGKAIFVEPINLSDGLARIRRKVPLHTDLSPGERQLTEADLAVFSGARRYYFRLLSRLDRFILPNCILETAPPLHRTATQFLYFVDRLLLSVPIFRRYAGTIVFVVFGGRRSIAGCEAPLTNQRLTPQSHDPARRKIQLIH